MNSICWGSLQSMIILQLMSRTHRGYITSLQTQFFHQCAHIAQSTKGTNGLRLTILHAFFRLKVSIALQRTQAIFVLKCTIMASEGSSRLSSLSIFLSLSLSNMLRMRSLEHVLFLCPFCDLFWILSFRLRFWSSLFGPSFYTFVGYFDYWCLPGFHYGHFPMLLTFKKIKYFEKNNH